jgi:predicted lipoprotein
LISPAFSDFNVSAQALQQVKDDFVASPDAERLRSLRSTFLNTYQDFQAADVYANFGPAEEVQFRSKLNNFPANTDAIDANIANGTWNLDAPDAFDRGLPALDYLLYGVAEGDETIATFYMNNPTALSYLDDIVEQIATLSQTVNAAWQGDYKETFINNTGTAAGTGISQLVNALNEHYENIKRDKIGIPSGVTTLGFTNPTRVEAFYSGFSLDLLKAALQANENLFQGSRGVGFDDYLKEVNENRKDDPVDVAAIEAQYEAARAALNAISAETLSEAVEEQNELVIEAYNALVRQIVRIKNDMPDALCVPITYIDNPSDSD